MRKIQITDKQHNQAGRIELSPKVMGLTIYNGGNATVNYSWNGEDKNITLEPGESRAFGGFDNYSIGDQKIYFDFGTGTNKRLIATTFTLSSIEFKDC